MSALLLVLPTLNSYSRVHEYELVVGIPVAKPVWSIVMMRKFCLIIELIRIDSTGLRNMREMMSCGCLDCGFLVCTIHTRHAPSVKPQ